MLTSVKQKLIALGAVTVAVVSNAANAALSPEAQAAADSMTTAANDYIGMAWSIVPIIVVGFIGIKLFRKAANKAT